MLRRLRKARLLRSILESGFWIICCMLWQSMRVGVWLSIARETFTVCFWECVYTSQGIEADEFCDQSTTTILLKMYVLRLDQRSKMLSVHLQVLHGSDRRMLLSMKLFQEPWWTSRIGHSV